MDEEVVAPSEIGAHLRNEMYELFVAHYDEVLRTTFEDDLSNKNLVILLRGADRRLLGFSTLSIHDARDGSRPIRYIFSGDTVMDANYWGPGHLLRSWFRVAGSIRAQEPQTELYWLLLVKGHRTYRILADFFHRYEPRLTHAQDAALIRLRDQLTHARYGELYDPSTGLITFPSSRGQLAAHLQDARDLASRPHVRDFLELNPHHPRGVELACIAELCEANLKSYAKVEFGKAVRAHSGCLA